MFFNDEAEARVWYRDDIANPDPEMGAVGLWAIGNTDDHLLDCHTFPAMKSTPEGSPGRQPPLLRDKCTATACRGGRSGGG